MKTLNLTQHPATPEQVRAGVVDLSPAGRAVLSKWLTFEALPSSLEVADRAGLIAQMASGDSISVPETSKAGYTAAMIGGAPFLMGPLAAALGLYGISPMYAFSQRESVETVGPDGAVTKTAVFRHAGFVQG